MAKKEKRLIRTHSESSVFEDTAIWVDRETGVNYLWHSSSLGSGLTPCWTGRAAPSSPQYWISRRNDP